MNIVLTAKACASTILVRRKVTRAAAVRTIGFAIAAGIAITIAVRAAEDKPPRGGGSRQPVQTTRCSEIPAHPFDLVLGRPTRDSVTVSVLCQEDNEGFIAYGTEAEKLSSATPKRAFRRGEPAEVVLSGLRPDSRYFYQLRLSRVASDRRSFHTARPPGGSFVFTITADPHLDDRTDPAVYQQTLANALADAPDFHVDLGDTFMSEKHANRDNATKQYLAQRYYFGQLCASAPLFLVLGNHDGESPRGRGEDADSPAVWANLARKRHFPNPVPDNFYTGDSFKHPVAGLLQDYYAWQWGDAQFIVLDPYWFSEGRRGKGDTWGGTLGVEQYRWLQQTLEASKAKFKFVFIHHLVGGKDSQCRGGAETAPFSEWGGKNPDGGDGFADHRPGWAMPIHQLLVKNKATIVFHGHDHLYAKQDLDGIVYQECPQPGFPGDGRAPRSAAEYGYQQGVILGSSGHLRVNVSPDKVNVTYVGSVASRDDRTGSGNREVRHSYSMR